MSVKDKIAMWNNISSSGSNSQPPASKPIIEKPKPVIPPRQEVVEKPIATGGSEVDTTSLLTPSMLRKKMQEQSSGQEKLPAFLSNNNSAPVKPITKPVNPNPAITKPIVQSQPVATVKHEEAPVPQIQKPGQKIESFSERKKRLQQQIQNNQFHLVAPQAHIRKVQSINIQQEGPQPEAIIEKEIPLVGVKQRAQQLSQFYQNKKQQVPKQPNTLNIVPNHHQQTHFPEQNVHQHVEQPTHTQTQPHQAVPHVEAIPQPQQLPKQTHQQQKQPTQEWDYSSQESSLAMVQQSEAASEHPPTDEANELMVRLNNKRKQQKRRLFESDED